MRSRVLITGASGFVAFHIIEEALKNGLEVFAAVRKSSDVSHLSEFHINYVYPDYKDLFSLTELIKTNNFDYIIHCAALTRARSSDEYNEVNAYYVQNLALAIRQSGVKLKKLVLISSLAAMGPLENLAGSINENITPNPITNYGKSKLLAEQLLLGFSDINYTILRPTAVYGPRDKDILIFFKQIAKGIEPYIGKIDQKLSFIYVKDLAKVAINALNGRLQQSYFISDGNSYDRGELGDIVKTILNVKTRKIHLPLGFIKTAAYLSQNYYSILNKAPVLNLEKIKELTAVNWSCDITKANNDLNFRPEFNLNDGLCGNTGLVPAQQLAIT